ncbi:MarR family winged helix-turn-helix transcriptional regulator [Kitasatospora sp. GAS204B]|uniref:MarR family winged helix-turn-helix transcriptional regulator n=1 Tax=unclassified Kitasatospora TaxID=2633591 RepID=UPI002475B9A1|nr:MarR family transcriptional regulator [Kitasatospora sp. GAS204B]MDH6117358.1 DNA-binding MarR family transcriptional regulator [Kitasatospora sp. GAS204B]
MTAPEDDLAAAIARAWQREQPDLPVGSIPILTRIRQAAKLLTDDRRRTLARVAMDDATLDLLSTLRRAGAPYRLTTRELAARSMITAGAVTQRVDRAEQAGLVRRLPTEPGSRAVPVELTAGGHAAVEAAVGDLLRHEQGLVDGALDGPEQAELAGLLAKLLAALPRG